MTNNDLKQKSSENSPSYSFFRKIFYTIVGFPPRPMTLPSETWDKWKNKYKQPEYDWTHHSGKGSGLK